MWVSWCAVAKSGPFWLYHGETAEDLAQEVQAAGGIMSAEDLKASKADLLEPLTVKVSHLD
jgi:gamma-glutamyltranspeptidase